MLLWLPRCVRHHRLLLPDNEKLGSTTLPVSPFLSCRFDFDTYADIFLSARPVAPSAALKRSICNLSHLYMTDIVETSSSDQGVVPKPIPTWPPLAPAAPPTLATLFLTTPRRGTLSLSATPFLSALCSCPTRPNSDGTRVGVGAEPDRRWPVCPAAFDPCTRRKLVRWLDLCVCVYRGRCRTPFKSELKRAHLRRIAYSSTGSGSEEAAAFKKQAHRSAPRR